MTAYKLVFPFGHFYESASECELFYGIFFISSRFYEIAWLSFCFWSDASRLALVLRDYNLSVCFKV